MACKGSGVQIPSAPPQVRGPLRRRPPPNPLARAADTQQPPVRGRCAHPGRQTRGRPSPGSSPGRPGPSNCRRRRGRDGRQRGPSAHRSPARGWPRPPARWRRCAAGHEAHAGQDLRGRRRPSPRRPCRPSAGCWWTAAPERRGGCRCCHRAREDQVLGSGTGSELAGDCLPDLVGHGHYANAGQAFWFCLEAAAEPTGLIADLDDLDAAQLGEDSAAAQAQQFTAAQPGPDLDEEVVAIERPTGSQEVPEFLGSEGSSALVAEDLFGVRARLGGLHLANRIGGDQAFLAGRLQDAQQDRAAGHHPAMAQPLLQFVLPAQHA
jgi:hypothetical protein